MIKNSTVWRSKIRDESSVVGRSENSGRVLSFLAAGTSKCIKFPLTPPPSRHGFARVPHGADGRSRRHNEVFCFAQRLAIDWQEAVVKGSGLGGQDQIVHSGRFIDRS